MPKRRSPGTGRVFFLKQRKVYQAQLYLEPGLDGKTHSWTRSFKLKREAEAALADALRDAKKGTLQVGEKTFLAEYLDQWLQAARPSLGEKTVVEYERYVEKVLKPGLGTRELAKLSPLLIQRFYARLLEDGRSPTWVRRCHATLHKALEDAVRWEILKSNPASHVTLPKPEHSERPTWTPEQLGLVLGALRADDDYPYYVLSILSGARAGELLGLTWADVDWEASTITIQRRATRIKGLGIKVADPKTKGSRRQISLPREALGVLLEQRARLRDWEERASSWQAFDLVFPKHDGGYRDPTAARVKLQAKARELGVPPLTVRDLRHLHATLLLTLGVNPKVVQQRLGHSSIQMTMDIYSHVLPSVDRAAAEMLGSIVEDRNPQANTKLTESDEGKPRPRRSRRPSESQGSDQRKEPGKLPGLRN